jgi:hypothetical protein
MPTTPVRYPDTASVLETFLQARVVYTAGIDASPPVGTTGTVLHIERGERLERMIREQDGLIEGLGYCAPITVAWDRGGRGSYAANDLDVLDK